MNKKGKGGHSSTYEFLNKDVRNSHKDLSLRLIYLLEKQPIEEVAALPIQ